MRYRPLAGVSRDASIICLGCADYGSRIGEPDAFALLDAFVEGGGNFLDTAHIYGAWDKRGAAGGYGNSELVVGRWIRSRDCRASIVLGTKGGHPDFDTGESRLSRRALLRQLDESLARLQTDYVDLYWLHRDDPSIPAAEILGWLQEPVASGRIRAIGCSHWRAERMAEARAAAERLGLPRFAASQVAWSLARPAELATRNRYGEQLAMSPEMWDYHRAAQLPVAAYNSQAGGLFAEKYDGASLLDPHFPNAALARSYGTALNAANRAAAREIARRKGCTTNQVALAWLLRQPFPTFAVVGPRDRAQLADSLGAAGIELPPDEARALADWR